MADTSSYPQIPRPVWWGVRSVLQRSPGTTIDERLLGTQLNVQDVAARQYVAELKRVGILNDEGRATELAQQWRLDESYSEAVNSLLSNIYPQSLLQVAPPEDGDRAKAASWFQRGGLGEGTAKNKAATYLLIGSPNPDDVASRPSSTKPKADKAASATKAVGRTKQASPVEQAPRVQHPRSDAMPLNINVQIHISADATGDQIESIFSAMRRYLYADATA